MNRSAALHAYLTIAASTPFEWASHDCCTFACDWCVDIGHSDPMARWRNGYRLEAEARSLIERDGGLLPMWELGMIEAQLPECDTPVAGDVGLVAVHGEHGTEDVGAIYGGRRWHMLSPRGLFSASIAPEHVIKTWRV